MKPHFTHDCDKCEHIYSISIDRGYDIYYCSVGVLLGSVIVRYSSAGSEYSSYPISCLEGSKILSYEQSLAISAWIWYQEQERDKTNATNWCKFVNDGKMFKERYKELF